jgi:meso-butanediol dehydrogenase/(S,S)-butanediol dehydrogenase/diacetyl reductase
MMTEVLAGKVAIVSGGSGGIGRAVCLRFALAGARVYSFDRVGMLNPPHAQVTPVIVDATVESQVKAAVGKVIADHESLHVLVNGAGIELEKTIEHTTLEEWNRIFAVNVTSMFLMAQAALPGLRAAKSASVINIGSYDGYIADPNLAAYCASKGAVHGLTRAMACDHGPEGIRVNAICPGYIKTPMLDKFFGEGADQEKVHAEARRVHPMRRIGRPEDVASLALWLASDEAVYASGQLWTLDGGLTAQVQQMRAENLS